VRRDGSAVERIGNAVAEYGQWGEDFLPSPSADGRSLVYGSYRTPCGVADCIRVLDIATGVGRSYGGRTFLVNGTIAAWSPTDDLIAYAAGGLVGVIRSDGTGQRVLAPDIKSEVKWMDWSPDGKWLLVSPPMGPAILFDVQAGTQLPIPTLAGYGATAWRP
jgi:Tol biopolymer transport system component